MGNVAASGSHTSATPRRTGMRARLRPSHVALQGAGYAVSQGLMTCLAGLSTVILARSLSATAFGTQSFVVSLVTFVAMFFDFGFFLPAARLAAGRSGSARQETVGAALVLFVPIACSFCAIVFALSFFADTWFHVHAAHPLRLIAALAFVYPLSFVGNYLAQGTDRLHAYSVTSAAAQALFVIALLVALASHVTLTVSLVLELRVVTMAATSAVFWVWLSPRFRGALAYVPELVRNARGYGKQVYLGRVLSMATYSMDVLMLGALTNARTVGLYTLAGSAAYLVALPVSGLCAALFPRMTSATRIEGSWLAFGWGTGLAGAVAVTVLAYPLIPLILGKRYVGALALIPVLALAEAIRGVTTVYNTYLSARGIGKALRNAAIALTLSNLAFNLILIPPFGAMGAAWASVGALVVNLVAHVVSYRKSVHVGETSRPLRWLRA